MISAADAVQPGVYGKNNSSGNSGALGTGTAGVKATSSQYGVVVDSAGGDGVYVDSAGDHGVYVNSAGQDGVHVETAGSPSSSQNSARQNGFEVAGAKGHGLYVGRADHTGVYVASAQYSGFYVDSTGTSAILVWNAGTNGLEVGIAGRNGVRVGSANEDGVNVETAGSPSSFQDSTLHNGFEVAGAEGHGLYVGRADNNGVHVDSAQWNGVYVKEAGSPTHTINSSSGASGFEVAGTSGNGVFVGRADRNGLYVVEAGQTGLLVGSAVVGVNAYGSAYAGIFHGDVQVTGNLTKGSGSFMIDHPLDPENKYLSHSFVESPDMKNIYDGTVLLDESGEAWVELPEWFEALNRDFRYQLTAIGAPMPRLYIAQEIEEGTFKIAGGMAGMKASWQVTGIRQDPYAEANRIVVEEEKPEEERGTYLHPEAYGMSETKGLTYKQAQEHLTERKTRGKQSG